ncbi:MAG: hypothetical protein ACK5OC_05050 [Pirellula sp.]|jgi:hypothetical protein
MTRLYCFAIFLLVVAIANWPYAYINAYSDSMGVIAPQLSNHTTQKTFTLAGWPFEFYLESMISAEQKATSFQWTGLVRCVIFWSFFPVLYVVGEKLRLWSILHLQDSDDEVDDRKSHTSQSSETQSKVKSRDDKALGTFRMRLWEMFVFTALVAGTLSYWLFLCRRGAYDKLLAQEIRSEGGFAIRTVMLPRFVTHVLPYVGNEPFLRLSFVQLKNPTDELVSKVIERPYLSSLGLSGGNYSFRNLNRLSTNPLLREVAIVQRQIDSEAISFIQSLPFIRVLNLKQTDITAEDLKAISQPQLEELNLIQTNIRLSELGTPAFSQSLRVLRLPLPLNGTGDSLLLEGWPNLVKLSCHDNEKPINYEPVSIVLRNLPNLKTIELDALQLFDIDVETVPNLRDIVPAFYRWQERTTSSQIVPSSIWPRRLRLKDVPKLTEFSFFPMNIESIEIDNSQIQVSLNAYNNSAFRIGEPGNSFTNRAGDTEPGFLSASDIPLGTRQKWIDDLSNCAIASLDLELVPLHDVKLNKLKENQSIRNLMLGKSGIVQSQLAAMEEMHQLEELSLLGIFVDDRTIESLLRSLPKLRRLVCEPVGVKNVQIKNKSELESLFLRPNRKMRESWDVFSGPSIAYDLPLNIIRLESLSIANATKLRDNFISKVPTAQVHIEGAPALKGLSFQHPLPSDAVIQNLRDLVFFAAGGPTCNDAIVNEVLNCKSLKSLTLAFTDLKSATLQRIANLTELESLTMTGSKIDNEFLASLSKLQKLRKLRLNETSLDKADLSALANLKLLEVLELGDWNLKPGAIETIAANHPRLKELSIVRGPLSENSIRIIANLQELHTLELSHCNIDDEMAKAFIETPPICLRRLFLSSSFLSEKGEDLLRSKNILFERTPRQRNCDVSFEIDPMRFSSN